MTPPTHPGPPGTITSGGLVVVDAVLEDILAQLDRTVPPDDEGRRALALYARDCRSLLDEVRRVRELSPGNEERLHVLDEAMLFQRRARSWLAEVVTRGTPG